MSLVSSESKQPPQMLISKQVVYRRSDSKRIRPRKKIREQPACLFPVVQNAHTAAATTATVTQYPLTCAKVTAEAGAPEVLAVVPLGRVPLM